MSENINGTLANAAHNDLEIKLQGGYKSNCSVCNHEGAKEAAAVYFKSDKKIDTVRRWFKEAHDATFMPRTLEAHFNNHVEGHITQSDILIQQRYDEIILMTKKKMDEDIYNVLREMVWQFIKDVYAFKPETLEDKSSYARHKDMSKQLVDLTKALTDITKTQINMMGVGKSEEEIKETMHDFMTDYLKNALEAIRDYPEAYQKLVEYISLRSPLGDNVSDIEIVTADIDEED